MAGAQEKSNTVRRNSKLEMTTGFIKENNEMRLWSTRDKNIEELLPRLRLSSD